MNGERAGDAGLQGELERLHDYMTALFGLASARALRLHAEAVSVEHMVGAAMEDEDSAAYCAVEHAFADPETLAHEMLALSTGIMVVGSGAALPFSVLALEALRRAHASALAGGADERVEPEAILRAAAGVLPPAAGDALEASGFPAPESDAPDAPDAPGDAGDGPDAPARPEGFFARFSDPAKAALSRASKAASLASEASIGPARLIVACLETDGGLSGRLGVSVHGARSALGRHTVDATEPAPRELGPEPDLIAFLRTLPAGAGSLELLAACHGEAGTPEMAELLRRHMVTPALLERAAGAFSDPS